MTQISMKIGRFIVSDDRQPDLHSKSNHQANRCNGYDDDDSGDDDDDDADDDDDDNGFLSALRSCRSANNLERFDRPSRNFSLPDFQVYGFGYGAGELDNGADGKEWEENDGNGVLPWMEDYSRTLCPRENKHLFNLFSAVQLQDGSSQDGEPEVEDEEPEVIIPLPWRSEEEMVVLEDSSKYLRDVNEATPEIKDFLNGHETAHPLESSSSSSFRNLPSASALRPNVSQCNSLSLSHWLSEAESRHSEPFCLQHHHVLNSNPASVLSSVDPRNRHPQDQRHPHREPCRSSLSSGSSSPLLIPDDEEGSIDRQEHVLLWLMANDLTEVKDDDSADHHPVCIDDHPVDTTTVDNDL